MATKIKDNEVLERLNDCRHVLLTDFTEIVEDAELARREWADFIAENSDAIGDLTCSESAENGE